MAYAQVASGLYVLSGNAISGPRPNSWHGIISSSRARRERSAKMAASDNRHEFMPSCKARAVIPTVSCDSPWAGAGRTRVRDGRKVRTWPGREGRAPGRHLPVTRGSSPPVRGGLAKNSSDAPSINAPADRSRRATRRLRRIRASTREFSRKRRCGDFAGAGGAARSPDQILRHHLERLSPPGSCFVLASAS